MSPRATCFRCDIRVTGQGHGCHALHHWFDRQGKEGGSDLLGARATIQASSRSRRTRISRVQGTGELANRFRPQSLLARRAPPARPYLTPYHSAWGTCYHVRGHEGEMIRASRLESHAAAQRFWFHRFCTNFPPRSPDVRFSGLGGRMQALPAAARDASLRHPPAPTLHRVNALKRASGYDGFAKQSTLS